MITQTEFRAGLLDPSVATPASLVDPRGMLAQKRYTIYRNNVTSGLIEALMTGFSIICALIGEENFRILAREYARKSPPSSPLMIYYGDSFPSFLANDPRLDHLPYLEDVARLEYFLRLSYHAQDVTCNNAQTLSDIVPEDYGKLTFELSPACFLLRSRWPIYDIWRFHTRENAPRPEDNGQNIVVVRPEFDPHPVLLPPGGGLFCQMLQNNAPLDDVLRTLYASVPDFDLEQSLSLLIAHNAFSKIEISGDYK